MIHNISKPQGTSSLINYFSCNSDFMIYSQLLQTILMCTFSTIMHFFTFLLTIFYLEILTYTTPCDVEVKPLLT
jgi:hypothetical protein